MYVFSRMSRDCCRRHDCVQATNPVLLKNARMLLSGAPNPRQDHPQKGDTAVAPSGGLPIAEKIYCPGLRLARPLRRNSSLDQHLLRFRLRYTNGLVRTHMCVEIVLNTVSV